MDVFDEFIRNPAAQGKSRPAESQTPKPVTNPMPAIRGRREDDVLWVRAEDVADALEALSPTTNARLIKKLRG
jgi:hypothetical protein